MKKMERWAWVAALGAVVIWGAGRGHDRADRGEGAQGAVSGAPTKSRSRLTGGAAGDREGGPGKRGLARRSNVKGGLARSLQQDDPLERMADFLAILASCDAGNIKEVEAVWEKLKADGMRLPAEEALLNHRLGQLKGEEVLAGRTGRAEDFESIGLLKNRFEGWLTVDPFGAKAWLESLPEGKFRDKMAMSAIATSMRDSPLEALEQVSDLPEHLRQTAGRTAGERLRESASFEESARLLADLGAAGSADPDYLRGVFDSLAGAASQGGGDQVARLVEEHLDQPYVSPQALRQLSAEMGKEDPMSALEWASAVEGRKPGIQEGSLLAATLQDMDLGDLDRAEAWARERQGSPAISRMQESLQSRRRILEDRGDDANEYDKDD